MVCRLVVLVGLIATSSAFSIAGTTATNNTAMFPIGPSSNQRTGNVTSSVKNATLSDDEFADHCTSLRQWNAPLMVDEEDCGVAIGVFHEIYIDDPKTASEKYEFLTRHAEPVTTLPTIRTPLRWVSGTCTLAVIMLCEFPSGGLPGGGTSGGPEEGTNGIASFGELNRCAEQVDLNCAYVRRQAGWAAVGEDLNIGLFLWRSGSALDQRFFDESNNLTLPGHSYNQI